MESFKKKIAENIFTEEELSEIEHANPDGMSSGEIVDLFARRGVRLSEATFRKYVQLGLLPRSRRVGSKGKHKGSRGVYPVAVIRKINEIKKMMAGENTIEDIRRHVVFIGGEIDELRTLLNRIFERLEEGLSDDRPGSFSLTGLRRQLAEARHEAESMVARLEDMAGRLRKLKELAKEAV